MQCESFVNNMCEKLSKSPQKHLTYFGVSDKIKAVGTNRSDFYFLQNLLQQNWTKF